MASWRRVDRHGNRPTRAQADKSTGNSTDKGTGKGAGVTKQGKIPNSPEPVASAAPAACGTAAARAGRDVPYCGQLINRMPEAIIVQDMEGRVEWINPAAEAMFGLPLEKVKGQKVLARVLPDGARVDPAKVAAFRYKPDSTIFGRDHLARHKRASGDTFWNRHSFTLLDTPEGQKVAVTCFDVSDQVATEQGLRKTQQQLQHAAHHDDLTGLANRKRLKHYLRSDLVRRALDARQLGVLQLDLDKFKEINDTLGHGAGDAALVHVADALRRVCGPHDLACRLGGDEFVLVCLGTATPQSLLNRAEHLTKAASTPLHWNSQSFRVGLSIGACLSDHAGEDGESLIYRADQALYTAKSRGRGRVVLYAPELGKAQTAQNQLARDIRLAVANQQLSILLQPQLNLAEGRITGCETLLRWNHPRKGQLAPGDFLETARRAGILADLDYQSMHLSLDALKRLHEAGFGDLTISLNVSAEILADANYPGLLDWALQSRGLKPADICVEITETTILHGDGHAIFTAIERLKQMGTRVALDDFGTGYAGLARISAIEVDEIKLDCSIIARIDKDPRNRAIVRSIIDLCRKLNTRVVAEGVETPEQMRLLKTARCPAIQGFVLAHPQDCDAMIDWLRGNLPLPDGIGAPDGPAPVTQLPRRG